MARRLLAIVRSGDWMLTVALLVLLLIGLTALYASGQSSDESHQNFIRQGIFAIASAVIYVVFSLTDYRKYRGFGYVFFILAAVSLLAVFLFGTTIRNTTGWFRIGSIGIQPVEFVKILWVLFLASFLASRGHGMADWKQIIRVGVFLLVLVGLTLLQPDLGSALVLIATGVGVLLTTPMKISQVLVIIVGIGGVLVASWFWFLQGYQKERIMVLFDPSLNPEKAYHVTQSIIAIGSGGWLGRGLGFGSQSQLQFLPEQQTDFIFAVIAEELGLVGATLVLAVFAFLLYRCFVIAWRGRDSFGTFIVYGYLLTIFIHIVINIGMNVGLFPVIGIPLPFISYGGSSLVALSIGAGIVQSVALHNPKKGP